MHASGVGDRDFSAEVSLVVEVNEYYRVRKREVREACASMLHALESWKSCSAQGFDKRSVHRAMRASAASKDLLAIEFQVVYQKELSSFPANNWELCRDDI